MVGDNVVGESEGAEVLGEPDGRVVVGELDGLREGFFEGLEELGD